MNRQKSSSPATRFPVWIVLLDFRSAAWLRWTASARALHAGASHPVRWLDSSATTFRPQAYGFAAKTLENTLFVRSASGLWHSGFDALAQLEQLLKLQTTTPRQWYQREHSPDSNVLPDLIAARRS